MSESKFDEVQAAIAAKLAPAIDMRAPYAKVMVAEATRAAIEAMRNPTTSMLFFGSQAIIGLPTMGPDKVRTLEIGYIAMIDEALK